jgi:hypothetical protein
MVTPDIDLGTPTRLARILLKARTLFRGIDPLRYQDVCDELTAGAALLDDQIALAPAAAVAAPAPATGVAAFASGARIELHTGTPPATAAEPEAGTAWTPVAGDRVLAMYAITKQEHAGVVTSGAAHSGKRAQVQVKIDGEPDGVVRTFFLYELRPEPSGEHAAGHAQAPADVAAAPVAPVDLGVPAEWSKRPDVAAAYLEGRQAYSEGVDGVRNPHPRFGMNGPRFKAWAAGWADAEREVVEILEEHDGVENPDDVEVDEELVGAPAGVVGVDIDAFGNSLDREDEG